MVDHKKGIEKFLQKRLHNSFIDVIFLENDDLCPPADYLQCDPKIMHYVGYILGTDRVQIPFIAEVWPDDTVHIYLNPQRNFYLAHLVGDLDA
ncbi:hypothetical protein [Acidianus ambivalens]|uniref:Uncharacterized protein n=1 Tax=Acidianus ambivalens TaxID=2283 RepID=A0A650CTC8_ACIAM|nr:hypothetical protein [Acidianus ambivalens]MQL56421.1 hypothetical protein [Acidianus ambivalens]QGR21058.1 hypothetical protein D1866_02755 [Acidianus ambivalens]